jgi:hypothetical protein
LLLVCLSPGYLENEYSSREFYERLKCVAAPEPIYFIEIPTLYDKGFEQRAAKWVGAFRRRRHFAFRPWFDDGAADLKEAAITALLKDANRVIGANGNLDRHNEHFVGRSTELRIMDTSITFLFEVVFKDIPVLGEPQNYLVSDRSVILEVEPESIFTPTTYLPSGEAAREWAKELAPQLAMQVVQKDLPHGFEPRYSVREIDQLPPDLDQRPAEFNGNQFRAWLL